MAVCQLLKVLLIRRHRDQACSSPADEQRGTHLLRV
jgi:hypothetical protein